jgi:hypothetical protein
MEKNIMIWIFFPYNFFLFLGKISTSPFSHLVFKIFKNFRNSFFYTQNFVCKIFFINPFFSTFLQLGDLQDDKDVLQTFRKI